MKLFLFILLMILMVPVFLLGYPFYQIPILLKRGRVSGTTYEPFNGRLLYHLLGSRPDAAALQLAGGLPATSWIVLALLIRPIVWVSRISGYTPAMLKYPPPRPTPVSAMVGARCEFFDNAIRKNVSAGDQVVILGAGWDTRAYGLLLDKQVTIFEVDTAATQAVKIAAIEKTGLDASHVVFVSCDFNRQNWLEALKATGFDPNKRTFILWEGVTMYLEENSIQSTLKAVSALPAGSRIAFDFFSREWLEDTFVGKMAQWGVKATYAESFTFGFPVKPEFTACLSNYLEEYGLALDLDRPMGKEAEGELPFAGLAMAVTPP